MHGPRHGLVTYQNYCRSSYDTTAIDSARPYIRKRTIRMEELTVDDMKEIINAENWDNKDKYRPSFYCLALVR